jgi:hypothetical protein
VRRVFWAFAVAALLVTASVGTAAAAGGNGASFCSVSTAGFNPGFANLEHVPIKGGLPSVIGVQAPVATSFCNPVGGPPNGPPSDR